MNVLNAKEMELDVLVKGLVLIALAGGTIGHGIDLQTRGVTIGLLFTYCFICICCTYARSRIHNEHVIGIGIGFAYGLQHLLVLETTGTEARQWLTAAAYGRLLIKVIAHLFA